jgi:lipopolysaccharide/colanic/teichoic acid biosynthesis glycosyltransferase
LRDVIWADAPVCGCVGGGPAESESRGGSRAFWACKRAMDVVVATLCLPFVGTIALLLVVLNPIWNPGPVFFRQVRMARGCGEIVVWKFRTMRQGAMQRGPEDPVEVDRITPLGHWLRRTRLDELPQVVNVIFGQMSLIGPRPDVLEHARAYVETVPGYRQRYSVRPGISGLAQVRMGYAEGLDQVSVKTKHDLDYIRGAGWWLEAVILWRTMAVMSTGFGAR